jgi:hypothetical protein
MSQITDQQTEDAQFGVAVTLWDPELSWASQRMPGDTLDNQGCPPGYGTIYTANGKVCRLVSTATAVQIQQDAAPGWVDQSIQAIAAASGAVVGGAGTILQSVGGVATAGIAAILTPLAPWLIIGGLFYVWSVGGFEAGREATSYARERVRAHQARFRASSSSKKRTRRR